MGQKQSSVSQAQVETSIKNIIQVNNQQITNIINSTVTEVTTNILQKNSTAITQTIAGGNVANLGQINIDSGTVKLCQNSTLNANIQASATLTQDAAALADLANQVNSTVLNKLSSDANLAANTQNAFALTQASGNTGGITGLATAILGPLNNALKSGSVTTDTSDTKNVTNIMNACNINNSQTTNLKNAISNIIKSTITQENLASCHQAVSGSNIINATGITVKGGNLDLCQISAIDFTSQCIIGQVQKAAETNKLVNTTVNAATADATTVAKMSVINDNKVAVTQVNTTGDSTASTMMWGGIALACCCCCLMVFILLFMMLK